MCENHQSCIQNSHIIPAMKEICGPALTAAANLLLGMIILGVFFIQEELGRPF